MNKIDEAWSALKSLPESDQEILAQAILDFAAGDQELRLTDEQAAEIGKRIAEKNPATMTLEEFQVRVRKFGA